MNAHRWLSSPAAISARPRTSDGHVLMDMLGLAALVAFIFGLLLWSAFIAAAIQSAPEPETRHFPAATAEQSYSRTQLYWGE